MRRIHNGCFVRVISTAKYDRLASFFSAYDTNEIIRTKKMIHVSDENYEKYFHEGFHEFAGEDFIAGLSYDGRVMRQKGDPYFYYTTEEINEIRRRIISLREVNKILKETVNFLNREGYIVMTQAKDRHHDMAEFTLTSKGFAHLNRVFESKTIKSNFHTIILKSANKYVSAGSSAASLGVTLKGLIVALLAGG